MTKPSAAPWPPTIHFNGYPGDEESWCIWWHNPWDGEPEKIAYFLWPGHPPDATIQVEELYENLARGAIAFELLSQAREEGAQAERSNWIKLQEEYAHLRAERDEYREALKKVEVSSYRNAYQLKNKLPGSTEGLIAQQALADGCAEGGK